MSFFGELRRRNVVKVAVAYAIVGWLLFQVADVAFPALLLPDWVLRAFIAFLVLGFPVALLLAWAFELTPEGMKRSHKIEATESITHVTGRKIDFAIIGTLVLALGFVAVDQYVLEETSETETVAGEIVEPPSSVVVDEQREVLPNSVAVLPFENLSLDPEDAFFAAGIHEEVLNQLAKLRALNVIARTSMMQYAAGDKSIPQVAEELNVETVMEGSVRYADGRVLVTAQLIDPETNAHLWSDSYNREFADVFAIQSDIAMNIANALEAEFSLAEQASIEAVPTNSPEAYAVYLRALSLYAGGGAGGQTVAELLDTATRLDPDFALAYARRALLYTNALTGNVPEQQAELERITQESAERALALDPTLGGAHAALAFVHQAHWRWDEAEREFEEALRLNPNDAEVLSQYSRSKRYRGEYQAAVDAGRRSAELDPRSWGIHYQLGINYRYARNYDAAVESFRIALELNSSGGAGHAQLAFTHVSRDNWVDAVAELQVAEQIYGENIQAIRIPQLANAYAQMGQRDEVERLFDALDALEARAEESPVNAALWALIDIALEDYDQALEWLDIAVDDQAPDLVTLGEIKANPYAIPELDEPRFQVLRDRIGT